MFNEVLVDSFIPIPYLVRLQLIICVVVIVILLAAVIALTILLVLEKDSTQDKPTTIPTALPTTLPTCPCGVQPLPTGPPGADGPYRHAVVASDAGPCSEIGRDILKKNGTAMDSAIASLFCIGIYNMHSAGIGGGGFMVVYNKSTKFVEVIDFREEAPGKANRQMYVGGAMSSRVGKICLHTSLVAHQAGAYHSFRSMKRLGVLLLSHGWDASPPQG